MTKRLGNLPKNNLKSSQKSSSYSKSLKLGFLGDFQNDDFSHIQS